MLKRSDDFRKCITVSVHCTYTDENRQTIKHITKITREKKLDGSVNCRIQNFTLISRPGKNIFKRVCQTGFLFT